jgi:hypothetical protein
MANNPRDNNQNPNGKQGQANVNDPSRDQNNDGQRRQQEAEQGKDLQQQGRPDDKRDERKPQQR